MQTVKKEAKHKLKALPSVSWRMAGRELNYNPHLTNRKKIENLKLKLTIFFFLRGIIVIAAEV